MLKELVVIIMFFSLFSSFSAQNTEKRVTKRSVWRIIESADAGFNITFPCDPVITKKLFQEVPKVANLYTYKCEYDGISFSVSLPERFEDFDPNRAENNLKGVEQTLRSMIGEKAKMTSKGRSFQNYPSRLIEVESSDTLGRQLHIEHPRGMYGIQAFGKFRNEVERSKIETLAEKFIDSFTLVENR